MQILNKSKCLKTLIEVLVLFLGIQDPKSINPQTTLSQFGMDSMMVIEIKETLRTEFEIDLSVQEIVNLTFAKLLKMEQTEHTDALESSK